MKSIRLAVLAASLLASLSACDSNQISGSLSNRGAIQCGPGPTMGSGC
jgi:hypothetical protein